MTPLLFLKLKDEVVKFHEDHDAEKNLITSYRSVVDRRRIAFLVDRSLHLFFWSALTNDISAFALFLFVSVLNFTGKWYLIGPHHQIHAKVIGPRLQHHYIRDAHPRYAQLVSAC